MADSESNDFQSNAAEQQIVQSSSMKKINASMIRHAKEIA